MVAVQQTAGASVERGLPRDVVLAITSGTLLNPLNSSMIAVALLSLGAAFEVSLGTATWLVSSFYIGGAVGMPLMGRLADRFGARRVFCLGLLLVAATGAVASVAPAFGWLVALRVVQAFGTSAAYPAGLAIFRAVRGGTRPPAAALGAISIASSVTAALGPVIGGGMVALAGWPGIFVVNVPIAAVGLCLALAWLPPDEASPRDVARQPTGVDLRVLATGRLVAIYAQFAAVNVAFYGVFFGLPLWIEAAAGYAPEATGLLVLPVAAVGVLATPVAARLIDQRGAGVSLVVGSAALVVGMLLMLTIEAGSPVVAVLGVGAVLGVPNGFNNLGLQAALYQAAPAGQVGAAGGLFQTFRYIGAIVATWLVASTGTDLHALAATLLAVSLVLLMLSVTTLRLR